MVSHWVSALIGGSVFTLLPGFLNYYSGTVLSYPLIILVYSIVALELVLYGFIRIQVRFLEAIFRNAKHDSLRRQQAQAPNYEEWYKLAEKLDQSQNREAWAHRLDDWTAKHFCWSFLEHLVDDLQLARQKQDVKMALSLLQQSLRKNVGGIFSKELYSHLHTGEPKQIVSQFVQEIVTTLQWVSTQDQDQDAVRHLLDRALATYGRTALCLSGGGMMGCYHLGILRALHSLNVLPKVISGASAGSLMAAFTCVRTDEELERDIKPEVLEPHFICCKRSWPQRIQNLWQNGSMFDNEEWLDLVQWFTCGDTTFQEAYEKTGRTLCITLSTTTKKAPPVLLNHLSAPHVVIASAVVASACVPGLLKPMRLRSKRADGSIEILKEEYWDGSIEQDIPLAGLAEQLNCQFFIVAQCNPHLVPFYFRADGSHGSPNRWTHSRRGGYLLAAIELYLKMDMRFKLSFLKEAGAVSNVTSQLVTQSFEGTTTLVPRVQFQDYFKIVEDPNLIDMKRYFQGGSVAAYGSVAMIKLHYDIARAIETCRKSLQMDECSRYDQAIEKMMKAPPTAERRQSKTGKRTSVKKSETEENEVSKLVDEEEDENEEGDDDYWEPIYSTHGSLLQGAMASPRASIIMSN